DELAVQAAMAPPMAGGEYLDANLLEEHWNALDRAVRNAVRDSGGSVREFFAGHGSAWQLIGRVCFHLAENRSDKELPFAFMATYSHRLSAKGKAQHLPLGRALQEYAGERNKPRLLQLLLPVQKGSAGSPLLKALVDSGEIFHPLGWTPTEALAFLRDIPVFESAGVIVRVPDWWKGKKPPRPTVSVTVGGEQASMLGIESMLEFSVGMALEGEPLTAKETRDILASTSGLALIRGKWVEIDRDKLAAVLEHWQSVERRAADGGLSFIEGMRLLSGAAIGSGVAADDPERDTANWTEVSASGALAQMLQGLRDPDSSLVDDADPGTLLHARLRPYQQTGVRWLWFLNRLGLGACLADDMGLGKTIQVLALLVALKRDGGTGSGPSLLVAPASLLANWAAEIERFAPGLRAIVAHPSEIPADKLKALDPARVAEVDLVITSYGSLLRLPWIAATRWRVAVLDEAQAIKSPGARQTRAAKALDAGSRIALTGTPVENRLSDLWSIFDFVNPGLLGSGKAFGRFTRRLDEAGHYGPLRELVRPYLLRRLKTDKAVIADLPDKTEVKAWCSLSARQAALYEQAVKELAAGLGAARGIARKGAVLAFLMRYKQILNHPSQWLGDGAWGERDSGKFLRLREIAEVIAAKQEKVLVFTQFREVTAPLAAFLGSVFGRPGVVLHGETAVAKRRDLVRRFQEDERVPFFVLSLKAGGAGLNLTAASHVVHFDRWWNPAVEDQATDRAFRIGQTKNVLVHKFVCRGTLEDRIDRLIESKRELAKDVIEGGAEVLLTEMSDRELLDLVALDLRAAQAEA
ncbi:MAG: DEAD/DEAH box helicase, partial [Planctomycetota bacterium]